MEERRNELAIKFCVLSNIDYYIISDDVRQNDFMRSKDDIFYVFLNYVYYNSLAYFIYYVLFKIKELYKLFI